MNLSLPVLSHTGHPYQMAAMFASIFLGVLIYNVYSTHKFKKRVRVLREAERLIREGHENITTTRQILNEHVPEEQVEKEEEEKARQKKVDTLNVQAEEDIDLIDSSIKKPFF